MDVSQAQDVKQLRDENNRLRKLVADLSLDKEALQSVIRKTTFIPIAEGHQASRGAPSQAETSCNWFKAATALFHPSSPLPSCIRL
jgi:hypothetical protein